MHICAVFGTGGLGGRDRSETAGRSHCSPIVRPSVNALLFHAGKKRRQTPSPSLSRPLSHSVTHSPAAHHKKIRQRRARVGAAPPYHKARKNHTIEFITDGRTRTSRTATTTTDGGAEEGNLRQVRFLVPFMFSNPMHASGILPDRYRLRHLVTCESRCKYFPFLSHFLPIAAGQPGTITRRRRWRDRTQCLSQTAAAAAADIALAQSHKLPPTERTGRTDGRMTSLPIYLLRGERGARRNLICRTRLAYHVRDIHSTPKPIRGQALS